MKRIVFTTMLVLLLGFSGTVWPALAQTGADYELSWWTTAGGGGNSEHGDFALTGTVGQAATQTMSGGEFTLAGGFLTNGRASFLNEAGKIYLPMILR